MTVLKSTADDLGLLERVKNFSIQTFITQLAIKILAVSVPPWGFLARFTQSRFPACLTIFVIRLAQVPVHFRIENAPGFRTIVFLQPHFLLYEVISCREFDENECAD